METIAGMYAQAVVHYQAGRLQEAEHICRQIIAAEPSFVGGWQLLAIMASRVGNYPTAIECRRRIVQLMPDSAEAHNDLGAALHNQGLLSDAAACYRRALELKPQFAEAHHNLGSVFQEQGELDQAIESYRRALELQPDLAQTESNLGTALAALERLEEAVAAYQRALAVAPRLAEVHINLGNALQKQGHFEEAIACYHKAIGLEANSDEEHNNLVGALQQNRRFEEPIGDHQPTLALKASLAKAYHGIGMAMEGLGELAQASAWYECALAVEPDFAQAHFSRSVVRLIQGDFLGGWNEYQWRWRTGQLDARCFQQPEWDGGSLVGKTILLHAEQGFGDTLQFVRYVPLVKQLGCTVIFECQREILKLLASCEGVDQLIGAGGALPPFDAHTPLMTLPEIFRTTIESIPAKVPYLRADAKLIETWRERLRAVEGFRVGINWAGRPGPGPHTKRDIPLSCLLRLADIGGVSLISLQKQSEVQGLMSKVEEHAAGEANPTIVDFGEELDAAHGAFMDTAAIMMNLDLVITSDTSVAHLAGALGVPVWVALPFVPDWRWMLERSDSPWYPTMRLFRQKSRGDWAGVFAEIEAALRERVEKPPCQRD